MTYDTTLHPSDCLKLKKKLLNTKCCRDLECPNSCTAGGSGYSYVHTEKLSGNISQK